MTSLVPGWSLAWSGQFEGRCDLGGKGSIKAGARAASGRVPQPDGAVPAASTLAAGSRRGAACAVHEQFRAGLA